MLEVDEAGAELVVAELVVAELVVVELGLDEAELADRLELEPPQAATARAANTATIAADRVRTVIRIMVTRLMVTRITVARFRSWVRSARQRPAGPLAGRPT
ncbi:MAG: hypothetical protein WCB67_19985 [Solirubrobacteraceae bacterium]